MANIGYARVSTKKQNLQMQIDALEEKGCERIFSERISTRDTKRPELERCFDFLRSGDTLVVYSLCRIARNHRELLSMVDQLEKKGVQIYSIKFNIDTNTTQGKLFFHIYSAMLEFERNWIQDKTREGLEAARARGRYGGRRHKLSPKQRQQLLDMYMSKQVTMKDMSEYFNAHINTLYNTIYKLRPDLKNRDTNPKENAQH